MKNRVHTERAPAFSVPWLFFGAAELFAVVGPTFVAARANPVAVGLVALPSVVATTHLFTLGTITMAMMGALY